MIFKLCIFAKAKSLIFVIKRKLTVKTESFMRTFVFKYILYKFIVNILYMDREERSCLYYQVA